MRSLSNRAGCSTALQGSYDGQKSLPSKALRFMEQENLKEEADKKGISALPCAVIKAQFIPLSDKPWILLTSHDFVGTLPAAMRKDL